MPEEMPQSDPLADPGAGRVYDALNDRWITEQVANFGETTAPEAEPGDVSLEPETASSQPEYPYDAVWHSPEGVRRVRVTRLIDKYGMNQVLAYSIDDGPEIVGQLISADEIERSDPEPVAVKDKGWREAKAARKKSATAERPQLIQGRRDEAKMPYPPAPKLFEATKDAKEPTYPYSGILTIGEDDDERKEQVTVIGSTGIQADGRSYLRTKEHGLVPAEQIVAMVEAIGVDPLHDTLGGIGPALYWKKVNAMARDSEGSPGVFKRLFNKFAESHPGLQQVGEDAAVMKEQFEFAHPRLSKAIAGLVKDPKNSGVYNFKEANERVVQASRAFYMARGRHPITIWATARDFRGRVDEKRKAELYKQREEGREIQKEIGPMTAREAIMHPSKLIRPELGEVSMAKLESLGYRAVAFANIQRIANDKHVALTNRQWAISLMNGERLSARESKDFWRYMESNPFKPWNYIRRRGSSHPRPIPFPRTA